MSAFASSDDVFVFGEECEYNDPKEGWIKATIKSVGGGGLYTVEISKNGVPSIKDTIGTKLRRKNPLPQSSSSDSPLPHGEVPARLEHQRFLATVQELFWYFDLDESEKLDMSEFTRLVRALMEIRDRRRPSDAIASATALEIVRSFHAPDGRTLDAPVCLKGLMYNATLEGPFNSLLSHADLEARTHRLDRAGTSLRFAVKSLKGRREDSEPPRTAAPGAARRGGGGGGGAAASASSTLGGGAASSSAPGWSRATSSSEEQRFKVGDIVEHLYPGGCITLMVTRVLDGNKYELEETKSASLANVKTADGTTPKKGDKVVFKQKLPATVVDIKDGDDFVEVKVTVQVHASDIRLSEMHGYDAGSPPDLSSQSGAGEAYVVGGGGKKWEKEGGR